MNFRLLCRQVLIATKTDTWRRLSGVAAALAATIAAWWWHSSIPPQVRYAAICLLCLLAWELFWWVVKFVAYTDKPVDELAAGFDPKTGARKPLPIQKPAIDRLMKALDEVEKRE